MNRAVPTIQEKAECLLEDFWIWRIKNYPEFATLSGFHEFDDKLEMYTADDFQDRKVHAQKFILESQKLCMSSSLKKETRENLEYLDHYLRSYIMGMEGKGYFFPINYLQGPHLEFKELIKNMKSNTVEDCSKILCRYEELPRQLTQMINMMKEGIHHKMTLHKISVGIIPEQIDYSKELKMFQEKPDDCDFYKPFLNLPDSIDAEMKKSILLQAVESITHNIFPAFNMLREFIKNEYFESTRPEIGISSNAYGSEFYQMCLDAYLTTHLTPKDICEIASEQLREIEMKMIQVIESLALDLSIKEFSKKIKKDLNFYYKCDKELIGNLENLVRKIPPLLENVFQEIPNEEIELKAGSQCHDPLVRYVAGNSDGSRPGIFRAGRKENLPKCQMVSLALHEVIPGRHFQATYVKKFKSVADFRKILECRKYSETPSRFQYHVAFVEGWGLYSANLGWELGLYKDPYVKFGHLSRDRHYTAMLVVDTGIHAFNWTFEEAVDYMLDHSMESEQQIIKEIARCITFPGQACACKIGQLEMEYFRKETKRRLGPEFNLPEFHDVLLKYGGSLSALEQKLKDYIGRKTLKRLKLVLDLR